jgi:hypothetical protein
MQSGYKPIPFKGFGGGLNLRDGPDVVEEDQAIDALNVLFTTRGSVGQRSGYAKLTQAEGTNRYDSLAAFYQSTGTKQLVAGAGNRLEVLDTSGNVDFSSTLPTANPHYFQRFGGPTAEHIYIANGTDTVRRWTGSVFETPVYTGVTPDGKFLGLSVDDNRLVNARFNGNTAGDNPSTVRFSMEGDPTSWTSTHYEDLTPGDGEEIMGVATWRDQLIVFKQTKFFVFYGQSVDDEGEPEFNKRAVQAGVGLVAPGAIAVAEQGVYFLDRTGIYFTDGRQPTRVSDIVEPIFHGDSSVYYLGGELNDASIEDCTMVYHDERLWLSFPASASSTNNRQLVFDPHEKWWSLADFPAGPMCNFRPGNVEELVFGYAAGTKHIGRYVAGEYDADDMTTTGTGGTAITARWQSGWFNYGQPVVKTIRESKISGIGLVTVTFYRDYRQDSSVVREVQLSPESALWDDGSLWDDGTLWGPSTIVSAKSVRKSIRGEVFSVGLSNDTINRAFKVHRLTTHVREARVPSVVRVN